MITYSQICSAHHNFGFLPFSKIFLLEVFEIGLSVLRTCSLIWQRHKFLEIVLSILGKRKSSVMNFNMDEFMLPRTY